MADRQTRGRRPTKAERKEQARHERGQIQRQIATRKRNRKLGTALVAIAAVVVVVAVVLTQGGGTPLPSPSSLLAKAASEEKAAGCGAIQNTPNYDNAAGADPEIDHVHIGSTSSVTTPPPLSTYPTVPPASGPHNPVPAGAGIYSSPPDIYRAIHSLEHSGVIVWYAPSAAGSDAVAQIRAFYSQKQRNVGQSKVIVAPYDYPSQGAQGSLPPNVEMALVAWHRLQTCARPNLAAALDFSSHYSNAYPVGNYKGVAREPNSAM